MIRRQTFIVSGLLLAAASGYYLLLPGAADQWLSFQVITLGHLAAGLLLVLPMLWYLIGHLRPYVPPQAGMIRRHNIQSGLVLLLILGSCLASGLAVFWQGHAPVWVFLHRWSSLLALPLILLHVLLRLGARRQPVRWPALLTVTNIAALSVLALVLLEMQFGPTAAPSRAADQTFYLYPYGDEQPFAPAQVATSDNQLLPATALASPEECVACHRDYYHAWQDSMHARSADDPAYQWLVALLEQEQGREATRWCAGCHNPVSLLEGQISSFGAGPDNPGITCTVCHTTHQVDPGGNASYRVAPETVRDYLFDGLVSTLPASAPAALEDSTGGYSPTGQYSPDDAGTSVSARVDCSLTQLSGCATPNGLATRLQKMLVRVQPAAHRADLRPELLSESEFCAPCHQEFTPPAISGYDKPVPLQDTYLEWLESPYNTGDPATATTCQDCHMTPGATETKPNPGRSADESFKKEHIYTHAFQGANVAIPTLAGDQAMASANQASLRGAAALTVTLLSQPEAGGPFAFAVEVANVGAGHHLPTGVGELRQMWLDVSVTDNRGDEVYRSGAIGEDGVLDPDAYLFNLVLAGPDGTPILIPLADGELRHQIWQVSQVLADRRIPAGASRIVNYSVPDVPKKNGPFTIRAVLRFRDFSQAVINAVTEDPSIRLPVTDMAAHKILTDISK